MKESLNKQLDDRIVYDVHLDVLDVFHRDAVFDMWGVEDNRLWRFCAREEHDLQD